MTLWNDTDDTDDTDDDDDHDDDDHDEEDMISSNLPWSLQHDPPKSFQPSNWKGNQGACKCSAPIFQRELPTNDSPHGHVPTRTQKWGFNKAFLWDTTG